VHCESRAIGRQAAVQWVRTRAVAGPEFPAEINQEEQSTANPSLRLHRPIDADLGRSMDPMLCEAAVRPPQSRKKDHQAPKPRELCHDDASLLGPHADGGCENRGFIAAQLCEDWSLLAGACTTCRLDPVAGPGFLEDPVARVDGASPRDLGWLMECERLPGPLPSGPGPTFSPPGSPVLHMSSLQASHSAGVDDPVWAAQASARMALRPRTPRASAQPWV
jgi:hypothetical protein